MQLSVNAQFDFDGISAILDRHGFGNHGIVQKTIDNAVIRWCMDYTPADTFMLAKSPYAASDIGSGIWVRSTVLTSQFLTITAALLRGFFRVPAKRKSPQAGPSSIKLIRMLWLGHFGQNE